MKTVRRKSSSLASPVPTALAVAAAAPRAGNTASKVFHESRNMVFPCPSGGSKESNRKPRPKGFHKSRVTKHESRHLTKRAAQASANSEVLCLLFFPPFPTISRHFPRFPGPPTPLGKGPRAVRSLLSCALWRGMGRLWRGMGGRRPPRRQHGLLGFHQPRITQHGFSLSLRRLQGEQPQARPTGFSRITNHETRITAFMLFSLLSCALWRGMGRLWRGMGGILSPSRRPRAVRSEIPAMCTKSRFPQENARSAAFAAAPIALGAQPAEVDANGHTTPGSMAKSPLIRCGFASIRGE